jgi:hypothetical protein
MLHNSFRAKKIGGSRRAMGHVFVELKDGKHDEIASEIARNKKDMYYPVFFRGYGMGILFANIPGKLEAVNHIRQEMDERSLKGKIAYIKFKLSQATFNRLLEYLDEYKKNGYQRIYNGENLPREGKGAGCSAFAYSFIELGNLLPKEETDKWLIDKPVAETLLGGPCNKGKRVSCFKILKKHSWTEATKQQYMIMERYDPYLIYKWIQSKWRPHGDTTYGAEQTELAKGIILDCSQIPTPDGSIWTRRKKSVALKLTYGWEND